MFPIIVVNRQVHRNTYMCEVICCSFTTTLCTKKRAPHGRPLPADRPRHAHYHQHSKEAVPSIPFHMSTRAIVVPTTQLL